MKTTTNGNYYYGHARILELKIPIFLTLSLKQKIQASPDPLRFYGNLLVMKENIGLEELIQTSVMREINKARKIVRERPTRHKRLQKVSELYNVDTIMQIANRQLITSLARPNMLTCGAEDIINWIGFSGTNVTTLSRQQS